MDNELFVRVCDEVIGQQQGMNGIGTLSEKTVHCVLKSYYSPDHINHEIKVGGFVADICTGSEIIEIQTRNFDKLRRKLSVFLSFAPVTIVYPIHNIKWIRWVNPQTGEISPPRKSPKPGSPYTIFPELYRIKDYLLHPNLKLKIVMINLEEYRFLDGWSQDKKKGSTRCDRIPLELVKEIAINCTEDYDVFLPDILGEDFTTKDYKKASGLPLHHAQTALHILHYVGAVDRIGKKGRAFLYVRRNDSLMINKLNDTSDIKDNTPTKMVITAAKKANVSDKKTRTPDKKTKVPAKKTKVPAKNANIPAKNANVPAKSSNVPAKNANASAKITNAPVKKTKVPAKNSNASVKV